MADSGPSRNFMSLRKKKSERPNISAPTLQQIPSSSSLQHGAPSSQVYSEQRERLQRRMSQRINMPINTSDAPPMPALPSQIPGHMPSRSQYHSEMDSSTNGGKVHIDLEVLGDPNFEPDVFVRERFANLSLEDMHAFDEELTKLQNRTSMDMQQNVQQNIDAFIRTSTHVKEIQAEMANFKSILLEIKQTVSETNAALGIDMEEDSTSRKWAKRSSIANLEALWATQMHELWKRVDGSQKFLPAIPGRHVIYETSKWQELHTATRMIKRRVHLIVLNDHFLVASDNPRAGGGLIAQEVLNLAEVELNDVASSTNTASHAFNIQNSAGTTLTFSVIDPRKHPSEKVNILSKLRRARDDLLKLTTAHHAQSIRAETSTGEARTETSQLVSVDGRQESTRWVKDQIHELEYDVALQRFEKAVSTVERLRKVAKDNRANVAVQSLMRDMAAPHVEKLTRWLVHYIATDQKAKSRVVRLAGWLIRLGEEQLASRTYLDARTQWIAWLTSPIRVMYLGDIREFMFQLSFLYFSPIRQTVGVYAEAFPQQMGSACVAWAEGRVREFNRRQSMHLGVDFVGEEVRRGCREQSLRHAQVLKEVQVDFDWLVNREE